ncbi:AAA family ATPase [Desulfobotulus sp. H1]|uniref:AAA family ATPase n=1 Tax=Desulfobotulus pelophilus TaxID=2823377 RepID=A0ABT3NAH8_9BACT|nr:AAA family ATPase [Desulfobotulus pelophilus]MCW7754469.1 AAA family ATPase [Desulfobotulus pelophilus]
MGYFHLLNLKREPFSNAPDPGFFYLARPHRDCLQQIEMSLRLRRGLTLVVGDVGAGKTTLCRHMYASFAEEPGILMVFVPDPAFRDVRAFLSHVASGLGLSKEGTVADLREAICSFLLEEASGKDRIPLVLIDEAQKVSLDIIEILREFLNFETNQRKLLQIVLVGQPELIRENRPPENFMDRVHLCHYLKPLRFRDTRELIHHRLSMAGRDGTGLFTMAALACIHHKSGGHPRKIIHLCHHTLLLLLIQNREKAGWSTVRQAASRLPLQEKDHSASSWLGGRMAFFLLICLNLMLILGLGYGLFQKDVPHKELADNGQAVGLQAGPAVLPPQQRIPAAPDSLENMGWNEGNISPVVLGQVTVRSGDRYGDMVRRVYGKATPELMEAVAGMNPHIRDYNRIYPGNRIHFPAIPLELTPRYPVVAFGEIRDLTAALEKMQTMAGNIPLRLVAFGQKGQPPLFRLVPDACLKDGAALGVWQAKLRQAATPGEDILITIWEDDLIFYTDPEAACIP